MRPLLTKDIAVDDFLHYYWLKEELQQFCRAHGLIASGSKIDITQRPLNYKSLTDITYNTNSHV